MSRGGAARRNATVMLHHHYGGTASYDALFRGFYSYQRKVHSPTLAARRCLKFIEDSVTIIIMLVY